MIWGEVVSQVRSLHLEFLDQFAILPSVYTADIELSTDAFPFPEAGEDYGEWEVPELPAKIAEALEFHPVERALMEGPLLPIQEVIMNHQSWDPLYEAILKLENEWLSKTKLSSPEKKQFIEQQLKAKFIQLQRRSGRFGLTAI